MSWIEDSSDYRVCGLQGWRMPCQGRLQLHHLLDERGNKAIKRLNRCNPPELTAWVCEGHHMDRLTETREGRAKLFRLKVDEFGTDWMNHILASLPWKYPRPEMLLPALLAGR